MNHRESDSTHDEPPDLSSIELLEWARAVLWWCGAEDKPMYRAVFRRVASIDRESPNPFVIGIDLSDQEARRIAEGVTAVGVEPSVDPPAYGPWYELRFDCFESRLHFTLERTDVADAVMSLLLDALDSSNADRLRLLVDRYVARIRSEKGAG